jgi:hypothetical protein
VAAVVRLYGAESLQGWLVRGAQTTGTNKTSARYLAKKAVVLLYPASRHGDVVWGTRPGLPVGLPAVMMTNIGQGADEQQLLHDLTGLLLRSDDWSRYVGSGASA